MRDAELSRLRAELQLVRQEAQGQQERAEVSPSRPEPDTWAGCPHGPAGTADPRGTPSLPDPGGVSPPPHCSRLNLSFPQMTQAPSWGDSVSMGRKGDGAGWGVPRRGGWAGHMPLQKPQRGGPGTSNKRGQSPGLHCQPPWCGETQLPEAQRPRLTLGSPLPEEKYSWGGHVGPEAETARKTPGREF